MSLGQREKAQRLHFSRAFYGHKDIQSGAILGMVAIIGCSFLIFNICILIKINRYLPICLLEFWI